MEHVNESREINADLKKAIAEARADVREQLTAAWLMHIDRVREQLESGWKSQLDHAVDERFDEIDERIQQQFRDATADQTRRAEAQMEQARQSTRAVTTSYLNQMARRLKQAESREIWIRTVLEAASEFSGRAALFAVTGKKLRFESGIGIGEGAGQPGKEAPLENAPAFQDAVQSMETVVAAGTKRELSETMAEFLGAEQGKKIYLFPIVLRQSVVGILYAEPANQRKGPWIDVSALELLALLASGSIGEEEATASKADSLVRISVADSSAAPKMAGLSLLPRAEQEIHLRAQRFARTKVSELLLYKVQQVRVGRAGGDLYANLKEEIDAARDAFRREFGANCSSMVDYYHLELVGTLANNDQAVLGPAYPGPLA
jgi:gas vesicle protein